MTRTIALCLAGALAATPAFADSPFDGTWKGQLQSAQMDLKPDVFSLARGTYACKTCHPPYSVKADGQFHAVPGHDYWDEVKVTEVDPRTVSFAYRKDGKETGTATETLSADGNTLMQTSHFTNNGASVPVDASGTATRVAAAPAGAHKVSGSWQEKPASALSDAALTMTIKVDGDMLHLKTGTGETLEAKLDGDYAPNVGDPGKTVTKAERAGPWAIKLTDMRGGKVVNVATYTISADGSMMDGAWSDPRDGSKGTFKATKM